MTQPRTFSLRATRKPRALLQDSAPDDAQYQPFLINHHFLRADPY
jgi:hypothetical protein